MFLEDYYRNRRSELLGSLRSQLHLHCKIIFIVKNAEYQFENFVNQLRNLKKIKMYHQVFFGFCKEYNVLKKWMI